MQQTLSDLLSQIDAAKGELDDLANEQQSGQRLLEAVRLEGQRLLARQEAAAAALVPAEECRVRGPDRLRRTFALKRPLCGLKLLRKLKTAKTSLRPLAPLARQWPRAAKS